MNKRTLKRIIRLWEDGLPTNVTIKCIIEMAKNSEEAAEIICKNFVTKAYIMGGRPKNGS